MPRENLEQLRERLGSMEGTYAFAIDVCRQVISLPESQPDKAKRLRLPKLSDISVDTKKLEKKVEEVGQRFLKGIADAYKADEETLKAAYVAAHDALDGVEDSAVGIEEATERVDALDEMLEKWRDMQSKTEEMKAAAARGEKTFRFSCEGHVGEALKAGK